MKLIIQIPCYNEEKTLPLTLNDLPRELPGIDKIETLIINDGSSDKTVEVAKRFGVNHIISLSQKSGLAQAFSNGLEECIKLGADIIVNTDGDNQYCADDIPKLIQPILDRKADMVIGCRDIFAIKHFSHIKKMLQSVGSYFVRHFSKTNIPDVTSGFRAYSREAALKLNIFSNYTYTLETIIQAGMKKIPLSYVNVRTNAKTRESRLIKSIPSYILRSMITILRISLMYEPLQIFTKLSLFPLAIGAILLVRFFIAYFTQRYSGHIQSLIIAAICMIAGFSIIMIGLLGDIISANRRLNEDILYNLKKNSIVKNKDNK